MNCNKSKFSLEGIKIQFERVDKYKKDLTGSYYFCNQCKSYHITKKVRNNKFLKKISDLI